MVVFACGVEGSVDISSLFGFDAIAVSFLACLAVRSLVIRALPDRIAGPGGRFTDTDRHDV